MTEGFTFVHLPDTHIGSAAGNKWTPLIVQELLGQAQQPPQPGPPGAPQNPPADTPQPDLPADTVQPDVPADTPQPELPADKPSFVVVSGDLTETGGADQYDAYEKVLAPLGIPIHGTLGNHESRWLDAGKAEFRRRFGPSYYAFSHGGLRFIVLDTSVSNQTHGHFERLMLDWLSRELSSAKDTPAVLFMHHPVAYPGQRFVDNEQDFLDAIAGHNVAAVFCGHGHMNASWRVNGIPFFMTDAAMNGGYNLVRVEAGTMTLWGKTVGNPPALLATVPLQAGSTSGSTTGTASPRLSILSPAPDSRLRTEVTIKVRGEHFPAQTTWEWRLDTGSWTPFPATQNAPGDSTGDSTADPVTMTASVSTDDLLPGRHDLTVRARVPDGVYVRTVSFFWEGAGDGKQLPSLAWRYRTGGGIQGQPAVDEARGLVYLGSNDGALRCLSLADGKRRWEVWTSAPIVSSPCLDGDTVYFTSTDGRICAVEATTGKKKWQAEADSAVVATPLVVRGSLYVGDTRGVFYALDATTGNQRWRFATAGLIRSQAAWGRGLVYVGSWDGFVYALDAGSGELVWKRNLARQVYYAPVGGQPLFYLDKLYITTPADPHGEKVGLHALDAATGDPLWQSTVPAGLCSPAVQNLAVVVNTAGGNVTALHPLSGEALWEARGETTVYDSSVVPFGGDAVMGGLWGQVIAVPEGGTTTSAPEAGVKWSYRLGTGFIFGRVAISRQHVLVPSMDGHLYALRVTPSPLPPIKASFADTIGHWAAESVARVAFLGLVQGYEDGKFRPGSQITRAEMATIMARYLVKNLSGEAFHTRFVDIEGHWAAPFITALEEKGLLRGEVGPDGTARFRPDDPVNRAELAAMIARLRGLEAPSPGFQSRIADMDDSWARPYVLALEEEGLVKGIRQGSRTLYQPAAKALRGEVAALLSRLAG